MIAPGRVSGEESLVAATYRIDGGNENILPDTPVNLIVVTDGVPRSYGQNKTDRDGAAGIPYQVIKPNSKQVIIVEAPFDTHILELTQSSYQR